MQLTERETVIQKEWKLPPLILHPFAPEKGPDKLVEGSKAQLILQGFLPAEDRDPDELLRVVLSGKYQEIRMLYFLGKDVVRWIEQCVDFAKREAELRNSGIREQSFANLLVESPPRGLTEKLSAWGVTDRRGIFSRAIGMNTLFAEPPPKELLSVTFLQNYHRFADHFYTCYQNLTAFSPLQSDSFAFEIFASEDYARKISEGWV